MSIHKFTAPDLNSLALGEIKLEEVLKAVNLPWPATANEMNGMFRFFNGDAEGFLNEELRARIYAAGVSEHRLDRILSLVKHMRVVA